MSSLEEQQGLSAEEGVNISFLSRFPFAAFVLSQRSSDALIHAPPFSL